MDFNLAAELSGSCGLPAVHIQCMRDHPLMSAVAAAAIGRLLRRMQGGLLCRLAAWDISPYGNLNSSDALVENGSLGLNRSYGRVLQPDQILLTSEGRMAVFFRGAIRLPLAVLELLAPYFMPLLELYNPI